MRFNHQVLNRVLAGVAVLVVSSSAVADILHVPGDFPTIQEAIDAAMDGDEVEVHPGTYFETINFLGKAITVRSSDGPEVTIIDAQQTGTVVTCTNGEGPDTVLDGFTVTGGEPSGMRNVGSSPTVTNCTFSGNTAFLGGAGAGMYNLDSSPTVTNCTFSGNYAFGRFGGFGGGMFNGNSSPTVTNCTFSGNTAAFGGGMVNYSSSHPTVTNCTFTGNTAATGGGMYNQNSSPTVTNCTFTGNTAGSPSGGAGMRSYASSPMLTNCTFSGNMAAYDGGGMSNCCGSSPTVTNCILWNDSPNEIVDADISITTVRYTDIQGGWRGTGNIDADPMFVDPVNGDFRLLSGSPSIDAGNNWGVPIDADDYDQDGNTAELFPVDLDGNPRFNADKADFDPGCGVPVVVDMSAYEYQFDPVEDVIFADLDGDGAVGILDLLAVLAAWGDARNNCLADLDIDGAVGIFDLLTLLAHWG
ncbi:MAG: right-handed parallel beta-helix repeat-containing protein [Planctomycetes bacterium]|nr:right-handed parallel beta-helix repeat-containing protein [Planctomycetota bacterium]